jgi:hypothetical protein
MNVSRIDLNLLTAFDALMKHRNVTRAAQTVGLSQSAMSSDASLRLGGMVIRHLVVDGRLRLKTSFHFPTSLSGPLPLLASALTMHLRTSAKSGV